MAMMTLGMFVFERATLPYQDHNRTTNWRFASTERFLVRKAAQFVGPGDDKISLAGALYGGVIGKYGALDTLRDMADTGEVYTLMAGPGEVIGQFVITSLGEKGSVFFVDGVAKKIDFTLELERVEDLPAPTETRTDTTAIDTAADDQVSI
jgi:phage protein U